MKLAALVLQRGFRANLCMREQKACYMTQRRSVISIQAKCGDDRTYHSERVRGWLEERKFKNKRSAAIKIQSWYRTKSQQQAYTKKKLAAVKIQRYYRNYRCNQETRKAIICLQAGLRGMIVRRKMQKKNAAATKIQSIFRGHQQRRKYLEKKHAAVTIQQYYRALQTSRRIRKQLEHSRLSAIIIQAHVRGFLTRRCLEKKRQAAIKIQSRYRGWITRKKYLNMRENIISLQRYWRATIMMNKDRLHYLMLSGATMIIQAAWRGYKVRQTIHHQNRAALIIQKHFRRHQIQKKYNNLKNYAINIQRCWRNKFAAKVARKEFVTKKNAAIVLQKYIRGYLFRKQIKTENHAACTIQRRFQSYKQRVTFLKIRRSVISIQKYYRCYVQMTIERQMYRKKCVAAITIQSSVRGYLVRRNLAIQHNAACIIQTTYKGWQQRRDYKRKMEAVIKLQQYWRGAVISLKAREDFIYLRRASIILQSGWRARQARCLKNHMKAAHTKRMKAAQIIQSAYRGWSVRNALAAERRQQHLNRFARVAKMNMAAIVIQKNYRHRIVLLKAKEKEEKVIIIQRWIRTKQETKLLKKKLKSIVVIQRWWRKKQPFVKEVQLGRAASKIQAAWRGYKLRYSLTKDSRLSKVHEIRSRLLVANSQATDNKRMGNRTETAISHLLKFRDFKTILVTVMCLDTSTRLSPFCCEKIAEEEAALNNLKFYLRSCNRSIPHMQLLNYVINIFINIAKYNKTKPSLYKLDKLVEAVTTLMLTYYEKGPGIFNKCCTLLYVLAADENRLRDLKDPKVLTELGNLQSLMKRRRLNATRGQRAPKFTPLPPSRLPMVAPDWALRPRHVREFDEPLDAMLSLAVKLKIPNK
ncbi:unnamed protein product [Meganyctiphanes norvegica]|uniref:Abnormal spindle-like microcephaly-associated protein n=1 Tax=Meganyctiphanes norvegica TaxID=48144 RepID=A0AAV2PSN5_MEGNR